MNIGDKITGPYGEAIITEIRATEVAIEYLNPYQSGESDNESDRFDTIPLQDLVYALLSKVEQS